MDTMRNVLFIIPNRESFDRNLYYRYAFVGEVCDYVNARPQTKAQILDLDVEHHPVKSLLNAVLNNSWDLILIWCETVADSPASVRIKTVIKDIDNTVQVFVYGDGPMYIPQFFKHHLFDGVYESGDIEIAITEYLDSPQTVSTLSGMSYLKNGTYRSKKAEPKYLSPEKWGLPPLDLLPVSKYYHYINDRFDEDKILAKPDIVAISASKGCAYTCRYCSIPERDGSFDRRRPIPILINWLEQTSKNHSMVHFMSPIFTANDEWIDAFCEEMVSRKIPIKWKAATRIDNLNPAKVEKLALSGCDTLCFGIETLYAKKDKGIKTNLTDLQKTIKLLQQHQIKAKAYVMVGISNQKREDIYYTIETLKDLGFVVRPTGYTPSFNLSKLSIDKLLEINLEAYDRKSFFSGKSDISKKEFYNILMRNV